MNEATEKQLTLFNDLMQKAFRSGSQLNEVEGMFYLAITPNALKTTVQASRAIDILKRCTLPMDLIDRLIENPQDAPLFGAQVNLYVKATFRLAETGHEFAGFDADMAQAIKAQADKIQGENLKVLINKYK